MDAEDLQLGDDIRNADGSTGEVESIEFEQISQEMYNLTVDEAHTFYVGDGQWLVHNACTEKYVFVGYHGTSTTYLPSILKGINPPKPGKNFYNSYELGPGFYTTKNFDAIEYFARRAFEVDLAESDIRKILNAKPSKVVVEIYAKNFEKMKGIGVLENAGYWRDFNPSLWKGYDYLQSPITGFDAIQTMFMPNVYDQLRAKLFKILD